MEEIETGNQLGINSIAVGGGHGSKNKLIDAVPESFLMILINYMNFGIVRRYKMKNKKNKKKIVRMGVEIALISQRNRVHTDKKKELKKNICRKSKRQSYKKAKNEEG